MRNKIVVLLSVLVTMISSTVVCALPHAVRTPPAHTEDITLNAAMDNEEIPSDELADGYYVAENESAEIVLIHKNGTTALAAVFLGEEGGLCIRADVHGNIVDGRGVTFMFAQNKEGDVVAQEVQEVTAQIDLSKFTISVEGSSPRNPRISKEDWWEKIRNAVNGCASLLNMAEETRATQ